MAYFTISVLSLREKTRDRPVLIQENRLERISVMKDRKIYCMNQIAKVGTDQFRDGYTLTDQVEEAAGILVRSADMKEFVFPESLRAIARAGAGVNNIPLDRCTEAGIVVFNTPGANANSVKELVLCALLAASRNVIPAAEWVRSLGASDTIAKEVEKGKKAFVGHEIQGKKLGVIGLGAIGAEVANAAVALGMSVYGYDPFLSVNGAWMLSKEIHHTMTLEELLPICDYITIHVPLTSKNPGMIGRNEISLLKEGMVFLNFSRDKLVDEEAMAEALEQGRVRAYYSDFANPLSVKMKNAVIFPHLGASTEEAENNCAVMAAKELQDYLDHGNITHSVNYPDLNMGICRAGARVAILHRNLPNMISRIASFFGNSGLNIENMISNTRGEYEYTLLDLSHPMPDDTVEQLMSVPGVLKVRRVSEQGHHLS